MKIEPISDIAPLIEDFQSIVPSSYLISTDFKRWLVQVGLNDAWTQYLQYVEKCSNVYIMGDDGSYDATLALTLLFNDLYHNNQKNELGKVVSQLIDTYSADKNVNIDTSNICKDLELIGVAQNIIDEVRMLTSDEEATNDADSLTEEDKVRQLEKSYKLYIHNPGSHVAVEAYLDWYNAALLYLNGYYSITNSDFAKFKYIDNGGDGKKLLSNFQRIYGIYNLLMENVSSQNVEQDFPSSKKSPIVFISHSSKDKDFVDALVNLLEEIGLDENTLFCSSVSDYGVPLGENIFNYLKAQFQEHDIFVIFVHTPNYYQSPICLNEMGAAWILHADCCSFLSKNMKFEDMKAVVNSDTVCIKVDNSDAAARLNELKDRLESIFGKTELSPNKWERKRNMFLKIVNA